MLIKERCRVLDTYRELLDLLVRTPTRLRETAQAAGDAPEGEWSAAQVLAHMAATERLWLGRVSLLISERDPLLRPPSAELAAQQESMMTGSVDDNLAAFNSARGETVSLLMGLSLIDWDRSGTHPTRGALSIADVVEDIVDHDAEHLEQLEALA
nr:DinB superfamily [uncultured bacterium]